MPRTPNTTPARAKAAAGQPGASPAAKTTDRTANTSKPRSGAKVAEAAARAPEEEVLAEQVTPESAAPGVAATDPAGSSPEAKDPAKVTARGAPAKAPPARAPSIKGPAPAPAAAKGLVKAAAKASSVKAPAAKPSSVKASSAKPMVEGNITKGMAEQAGSSPQPAPKDAFLKKQRELLLLERANYLRQAEELKAEADSLAAEHEPGDVQFDEEGGEGGTVNVDRELDLVLSAQARAAIAEIDHALAKMEAGTYGVCEKCAELIPEARLDALPHASLCVACKSGGLSSRR